MKNILKKLSRTALTLLMLLSFYQRSQADDVLIPWESGTVDEILPAIDHVVEKNIKNPQIVASLISAAKDPNIDVRIKEHAVWALGQLHVKKADDILLNAGTSKSLLVRSAALNALFNLRSNRAYPLFVDVALYDPILSLRVKAITALGAIRSERAIPHLVKLAQDEKEEVRGAVALAMGAIHSKKNDFTPILTTMSADLSSFVVDRANKSLQITKRNNKDILTQLKSLDSDIRFFAALYFTAHGTKADRVALQDALLSELDKDVHDELQKAKDILDKRIAQDKARQEKKMQGQPQKPLSPNKPKKK